jgi:hypothetical protein
MKYSVEMGSGSSAMIHIPSMRGEGLTDTDSMKIA